LSNQEHSIPGWELVTIADVTNIRTGKLDANAADEDGAYPFFTCAEEISRINSFSFDTEAVLLGGNGFFGVKWYRGKFDAYQRTYVIEPVLLDVRFLYYLFLQLMPTITKLSRGSTIKYLRIGDIQDTEFQLPPFHEQTRIVEKLEELLSDLDAGVAELKAAQRKLAQYRQSLLKAAVEGALTADWRATGANTAAPQETGAELLQRILTERRARWEDKQLAKFAEQGKTPPKGWQDKYNEPVAPDTDDVPALPVGWVWATVSQLSQDQRYGSSAKTDESTDGVPVLRMGNIQDGELDLSKLKYLPQGHHEFPDMFLEDGELLFNRTNSPELVGKTTVYRSQIVPCSYASYLISVKLSPRCVPELIAAYINSAHGRHWIKSVVTQQVGQANVNGTKLAALAVPLPPEEEQQEIVTRLLEQLSAATEQALELDRSVKQTSAQRKNILKAAFAGQLVPQDSNDEPASALLERIRTGRGAGGNGGKKAGRKHKESA
jgi:type I restriction enzyme S subunit